MTQKSQPAEPLRWPEYTCIRIEKINGGDRWDATCDGFGTVSGCNVIFPRRTPQEALKAILEAMGEKQPAEPVKEVSDEMVERACRVQHVGWSLWHEPQKKTAREVMHSALSAALSRYGQPATSAEPVAWANWKVGTKSYVPFHSEAEARASVERSEIAATQEGPYEVVALVPQPAEPVKLSPETQDQIAAVMLQTGTPEQQAEALRYCGVKVDEPVKEVTEIDIQDLLSGYGNHNVEHGRIVFDKWTLLEAGRALLSQYGKAAQPAENDEESAEDAWRRLALQFDGHRMQALGWLKAAADHLPEHVAAPVSEFLKAPPLSGEQVLAERIAAMAAQPAASLEPEWIDDPHDIEQGMMRNPKYVAPVAAQHVVPGSLQAEQDKPDPWGYLTDQAIVDMVANMNQRERIRFATHLNATLSSAVAAPPAEPNPSNSGEEQPAANVEPIDTEKCAQAIYENGTSIGLFDIPKDTANAICSGITAVTGARVDWHYIGGRVHIKGMPPAPVAVQQGVPACPRCDGSGTILRLSDNSPDAHDVEEECPDCDGTGVPPATDGWRHAVQTAYGHLWMVNNEPGAPNQYAPEKAAYEARKLLRDLLTTKERGEGINAAKVAAATTPPADGQIAEDVALYGIGASIGGKRINPQDLYKPADGQAQQEKRWPFVESPGEFAARLGHAIAWTGGNLLGAVRHVLIENPPTLAQQDADRVDAQPGRISDKDRLELVGALGLLTGHGYKGCAAALQRVLDNDIAPVAAQQSVPGWKLGGLLTVNKDEYPALGGFFAQVWEDDEVVARVYGNDRDQVLSRASMLIRTQPVADQAQQENKQ